MRLTVPPETPRSRRVAGRRAPVLAGWLLYAGVYLAFALVDSPAGLAGVFLGYGVVFGLTEPAEKARTATSTSARLLMSAVACESEG